ncbi:hypothetical protein EV651_112229 [Kribbella sp. VKM Ac-2571]|nr:hypothetical protein EV651_112229 [Kribbella sp. VKM Ac-2571]
MILGMWALSIGTALVAILMIRDITRNLSDR